MNWTGGRRSRAGGNAPSAPARRQKQYFARVRAAQTSAAFSGHSSDDGGPVKRRKLVMPEFDIVVGQCARKKYVEEEEQQAQPAVESQTTRWTARRPVMVPQFESSPQLPPPAPSIVTAASRNYGLAAAFKPLSAGGYVRIGRTTVPQPSDDNSQESMLLDHEEDPTIPRFSSSECGAGGDTEAHLDSDPFVPRHSPGTVLCSEPPCDDDGLLRDIDEANVGVVYRPLSRARLMSVESETPESPTGYRSAFLSNKIPTSDVSSNVAEERGNGVGEIFSEEGAEESAEDSLEGVAEDLEADTEEHQNDGETTQSPQNDDDRWHHLLPPAPDSSEDESDATTTGIRTDIAEASQAFSSSPKHAPTTENEHSNTAWKSFITNTPPPPPPPPQLTFTFTENRAWRAFVFASSNVEEEPDDVASGSSSKSAGSSEIAERGSSTAASPEKVAPGKPVFRRPGRIVGEELEDIEEW